MGYAENPKPNYNFSCTDEGLDPSTIEFQVSDYLMLDDGFAVDDSSSQTMLSSEHVASGSPAGYSGATKHKNGVKKNKTEVEQRIAFRTKSDLEIMDDGFKWRKYGKKSVKNSPNPRNYYKCSSSGCSVKKRVEREREDPRYVITSYDGVHNHESPCMVYYSNQMPLMAPSPWTWQPSTLQSSSSS
ncbi:hypothetical protein SADUNF_Sadunf07G0071700 [Salix dunnii]|uniref:WRKY domain-containing protein n=1 Tax=Salix dunnii TaxID=1413687 RepID=A0A835MVW6_9ROSI|nr:hypothetical protein SADUNF_Sadunf07G0071700 [Salix dunnii]